MRYGPAQQAAGASHRPALDLARSHESWEWVTQEERKDPVIIDDPGGRR